MKGVFFLIGVNIINVGLDFQVTWGTKVGSYWITVIGAQFNY